MHFIPHTGIYFPQEIHIEMCCRFNFDLIWTQMSYKGRTSTYKTYESEFHENP